MNVSVENPADWVSTSTKPVRGTVFGARAICGLYSTLTTYIRTRSHTQLTLVLKSPPHTRHDTRKSQCHMVRLRRDLRLPMAAGMLDQRGATAGAIRRHFDPA